jgi:hypothetical protein
VRGKPATMTVTPEARCVQHGPGGCTGRSFISASITESGNGPSLKLVQRCEYKVCHVNLFQLWAFATFDGL